MVFRRSLLLSFPIICGLAISACGGGGSSGGGSAGAGLSPSLKSISVSGPGSTLFVGQTEQLTATGHFSDGSTQDISSAVTWSSSNTLDVTVDSSGMAQAVAAGSATITASSGSVSGTDNLTLNPDWSATASLTDARAAHASVTLANGKILVVGGYQGSAALASAELYDPAAKTWSPAASMPAGYSGLTATLLPNGKVLMVCSIAARIYDPATDSWSSAASPTYTHWFGTATLLANGKVLLVGGGSAKQAELYDPASDSWSSAGSLPAPLSNVTATLLANGKVFLAGGYTPSGTYMVPVSQNITEIYDPATNSWAAGATMATARSSHSAVLLANGKVLVAGGIDHTNPSGSIQVSTLLASAEIYDPATDSWSPAASMPATRYGHTGTTLPDGTVLVVEGVTPLLDNSALLYDPASDNWSSAGSLASYRKYQFTATLLSGGSVLVVGGTDGSTVVGGAEIYH